LLEGAREKYLNAVHEVRSLNSELALLPLFNAGNALVSLSVLEQNVVENSELLESALKEFDDVIRSSSDSTSPRIRVSAIAAKLLCMDELAIINPVSLTEKVLTELDRLEKELDELRPRSSDPYLFAFAYGNLSWYCLRLLRVIGKEQERLLDKAEENALKAYEMAQESPLYDIVGTGLYNMATTRMIRAVTTHDVRLLTEAGRNAKRSAELLERNGSLKFLIALSFGIEVQVMKYGYTDDQRDLDRAIELSKKAVPLYAAYGHLQTAGEESFRLATLYMLRGADRKAERALNEAAKLFRRSGKQDLLFREESLGFSTTCTATRKLVQAQIAFKAGRKMKAAGLVEEAEKEMTSVGARWREIWLIRGFKELIVGNLDQARTNLSRIIRESLDVLEDKNPTSTGSAARRLVKFMSEVGAKNRALPPASLDLPLKSEAILAALRLRKLSKQISTTSAISMSGEAEGLDLGDIRDIIKRLMARESRE
jgi:tetratricopeptide (TPR) repeat protein